MIRHVLPSNSSVQFWRWVDSWLMEHLWGQSSRVGLLMGSKNAGTCLLWSWGLGAGICALWSCGFWAWADLQRGLCQQDCSWFCSVARPCLTFSSTAGFLAGAEPPGQRHLRWGWSHEGRSWLTIIAVCTMYNMCFRCCWCGSHTTDAFCSTGHTWPL